MEFCPKCGRRISSGEICSCGGNIDEKYINAAEITIEPEEPPKPEVAQQPDVREENKKGLFGAISRLRKYIKDYSDYETDVRIVPDIVRPNNNEIPIKQFSRVAVLRSPLKLSWALGKIQVTNQRFIFRAAGRSLLNGKTSLQQEFSIDAISGIDIQKDYHINILNIVLAVVSFLAGHFFFGITLHPSNSGPVPFSIVPVALICALLLLWCYIGIGKGKYVSKIFLLGGIFSCMAELTEYAAIHGRTFAFIGTFLLLAASVAVSAWAIVKKIFTPNISITVKSMAGKEVIEIRRRQSGGILSVVGMLFGGRIRDTDFTGFGEVFPSEDSEAAIRELGAIINDIQRMGDYAVDKWKE